MKIRKTLLAYGACALLFLTVGCSKPSETKHQATGASTIETPPSIASPAPAANSTSPTFDAIDRALAGGAYDSAAAQLLEMRARGKEFSDQEAARYRKALNDAYLQALEAAQKGDPRAKAAIELIRANSGG